MKLKQVSEAKYAGEEPALVSIDWGEFTDVYGPFNSFEAAQKFENKFNGLIEEAGFDPQDVEIFNVDSHTLQQPDEAITYIQNRIRSYQERNQ